MASWLDDVLGPAPTGSSVTYSNSAPPPPPTTGGGSSGTSSAPGLDINALLGKLSGLSGKANSDSLAQYKNLMTGVNNVGGRLFGANGIYDRAQAQQTNMGQAQNAQITAENTKNLASSDQDLTSRGLGNTTIRESNQRGINNDTAQQRANVAEQVATAKSGLLTQRAGALQNFANYRTDSELSKQNVPPDLQTYMSLIQNLSANGGGNANAGRQLWSGPNYYGHPTYNP